MWLKMGISSISALRSNTFCFTSRVCLISVLLMPCCGFAAGLETRFGLDVTDNIVIENNLFDTDHPENGFGYDSKGNEIILSPSLNLAYGDSLNVYFLGDFSWTHYIDDHDDDTDTDIGAAMVCVAFPKTMVTLGIQPVTAGRGMIDGESEPGLSLDVSLSGQLSMNVSASALDDSSALYALNLDYTPGLFEKINVFAAYYNAGHESFSGTFYLYENQTILGTPVTINFPYNTGYLSFIGAGADLIVLGNYLQFTVIAEQGEITFDSDEYMLWNGPKTITRTVDVSSFLADVEISRNLSDIWSVSGFLRAQSGGRSGDSPGQLDSYVTPVPLTYRTLVFNQDQFFPESDQNGLISNAVIHSGLVAPGLSLSFTPRENIFIKGLVSGFYPYRSVDGASFYGWEWDLSLKWKVSQRIDWHAQAGWFYHGDVAEDLQGEGPPPASCIVTGITVSF